MVARITGSIERFEVTEEAANKALSSPVKFPIFVHMARASLGLLAVQRGDVEVTTQQYAALDSLRGTMLVYISGDRVLGLLAQTMGDLVLASTHFEDALAFCRKAGYRPELAWTCCDYADTLLPRNAPGDRSKATHCWTSRWPSPASWACGR